MRRGFPGATRTDGLCRTTTREIDDRLKAGEELVDRQVDMSDVVLKEHKEEFATWDEYNQALLLGRSTCPDQQTSTRRPLAC